MQTPYAPKVMLGAWVAAGWAGVAYGLFLTIVALRFPPGADLTGQWAPQPVFKASMAGLLVVAAAAHPRVRERRWLMPALLFSAVGDALLAVPWWTLSFLFGLGSFLLAHLCFLGALLPLAQAPDRPRSRWVAAAGVGVVCVALLAWFRPRLGELAVPVTVYMVVLAAMVSAALLAALPTPYTAAGALLFAGSDAMIGIGRFALDSEALAVPVWWTYAAAQILITAGLFFGRASVSPATPGE